MVKADLLSASQGDAAEQFNLGYCYYYGKSVTQNREIAIQYYALAADQDYARGAN